MLSKKEIKDIQSLSHKKSRDEAKLFVAEGAKIVNEMIKRVPGRIQHIYATAQWCKNNPVNGISLTEVEAFELEKISQLSTPNQVLAVVNKFDTKEPSGPAFYLFLDAIQDPGNLGTIIRIADWFNIKNIVCSAGCADLYNPKTVQSTMASIANVSVYYDTNGDWLQKQKVPVLAATLNGTSIYSAGRYSQGVLIIGNESKGISPEVLAYATTKVTIPGSGTAESLNASVAAGIILSHLLK